MVWIAKTKTIVSRGSRGYFINDFIFVNYADLHPISYFKRSIFGSLLINEMGIITTKQIIGNPYMGELVVILKDANRGGISENRQEKY